MIIIDEILISDDVIDKKFVCDLHKCKGACCKAGDFGAPLEEEEVANLQENFDQIKDLLPKESLEKIDQKGFFRSYQKDHQFEGTQLLEDGTCVFARTNELGILECGIEKAHHLKRIEFNKPISCHLYPIRVSANKEVNLTAVNYSEWDICNPACSLGEKTQIPLYQFVKDALIRKFGEDFYQQLDGAYQFKQKNKKEDQKD